MVSLCWVQVINYKSPENKRKEELLQVVRGITFQAVQLKKRSFLVQVQLTSETLHDMAQLKGACDALSTFTPQSLDGLTLHSPPWLQSGLRQNELRSWLRQYVVAKYLLGWRRWCWRHAHCVQKHWSALLVLRPNWCRVVEVLEASRDLNGENDWKECG